MDFNEEFLWKCKKKSGGGSGPAGDGGSRGGGCSIGRGLVGRGLCGVWGI